MTQPETAPAARVPFSFELLPPRTPAVAAAMPERIAALAATRPEFLSVTYGAGGSSREASLDLVRHVLAHTDVPTMAHLTCVASTAEETGRLVRRFLDAGVTRFLALRGDAVDGVADDGDLRTSAELVQLIHRVQAERVPYTEERLPGRREVLGFGRRPRASIAVAAFVNGHPDAPGTDLHIDALLAKQTAGAELALTQMFFDPAEYVAFVERAAEAGVSIPIVPGIVAVTSVRRLHRVAELTGEAAPIELLERLEREATPEGQREAGIAFATAFAAALIDAGAPALHLYTYNVIGPALEVLRRLGLIPADDPSTAADAAGPALETT